MIPHLTWWQRLIGWLLWKLEAKHGFGGGFSDPMEGAEWMFEDNRRLGLLYSVSLLRNYYYIKQAERFKKDIEEWERTHG